MINKLHLIYGIIICAILILASIVCFTTERIPQQIFDCFSFASTITSIVLAVVSIVYSITSGSGVEHRLNEMKDIERKMTDNINKISRLEESVLKNEQQLNLFKDQLSNTPRSRSKPSQKNESEQMGSSKPAQAS